MAVYKFIKLEVQAAMFLAVHNPSSGYGHMFIAVNILGGFMFSYFFIND